MRAVLLVLALAACGTDPRLAPFPMRLQISAGEYPEHAQAIQALADEVNARIGCAAVTLTDAKSYFRIHWSNHYEMTEHFPMIKHYGGLGTIEDLTKPNGLYDEPLAQIIWLDTQADPKGIALIWLHFLAYQAGVPDNTNDPYSIGYNHPTWAEDPVGALFAGLGGEAAARTKLCQL